MLVKFIDRNRLFFLKFFNLLPISFQKRIKSFYRQNILKNILSNAKQTHNNVISYENGAYKIHKLLNSKATHGVNLIGFPSQEFGLGQHLKNVALAFEKAAIPIAYYDCSFLFMNEYNQKTPIDNLIYNINIFVCNGDGIAKLFLEFGEKLFKDKYNIHYGAWEIRDYPKEWIAPLTLVDEYWAMSSFLQKSVSDSAILPVIHMPYPVEFNIPNKYTKKDFQLPSDKFLYLFTFDMSSVMQRKNPEAVINAFYEAFPKEEGVGLVIKMMSKKNLTSHQKEIEKLQKRISADKRIYIIDELLPRDKILDLINCCDVYVSLHRAEGFGIGMAEAMRMKKPVIATNYSGNTDFTLADNSCLVGYKLKAIGQGEYIYEDGKYWADADIKEAANYMKKLYDDKNFREKISKNAERYIEENYSADVIKNKYISRLKILGLI